MDFHILGSLEVLDEGRTVVLGGSKQKELLGLLVLHANETMTTDRLAEQLWERPPTGSAKAVQVHVSRLRKVLANGADGEPVIVTRDRGYELHVDPERLDLHRFERLAASGRAELAAGRPERAAELLERALALWRGAPLADLRDAPFAQREIGRLEELRVAAVEQLVEAKLELGGHAEVVGELEALIAEHPYRERLRAQLMLALYRCDRQADALQAYQDARRALVEQLGIEPGARLRELERAILEQDPALLIPSAAEAARRLHEQAGRAAGERSELRDAESELEATVLALRSFGERAERGRGEDGVVTCPFKGLASFDVEDAAYFCGRERLVAEMVARLAGAPLMGLVGDSGSGKSSALRAGLLAALAAGALPGSERWAQAPMRPGEHPRRALARALEGVDPSGTVVIAVDQFEETFTACRYEAERAAFARELVAATRDERRRAVVLVAVRADYYARCAAYPELARLLAANHVLVGAMRRDELRRAIERPAARAGLEVEPALSELLIADVGSEPGALPLLSTALLELWRHREDRRLTVAAYERTGGVQGAVARLAEDAYLRLDGERRELVRRIMLRLAGEGEGGAPVRCRVPLAALEADADGRVAGVLSALAADRLITIGEGEVEVAHEALLREWPRLRDWLEEDAHGRRVHRQLGTAARQWEAGGRESADLYRGPRLHAALEWCAVHEAELNRGERAFLAESRRAGERAQRRLRLGLAAMAALLAIAVVAGAVALSERGHARAEAVVADAQHLGSQALVEDDLARSLLLAAQGAALHDSVLTRGNVLAALLRNPGAIGELAADDDRLLALELSPDGRTLAFVDHDGLLSFAGIRPQGTPGKPAVAWPVGWFAGPVLPPGLIAFSDDGAQLAIGGDAPVILDPFTQRALAELPYHENQQLSNPSFSPDGTKLYAAVTAPPGWVPSIRSYDTRTGRQLRSLRAGRPLADTPDVAASAVEVLPTHDGRRVITTAPSAPSGDGAVADEVVVRDARSLRVLRRIHVTGVTTPALAPDDRTLLVGGQDGSVRFVDLRTGAVEPAAGRHVGAVTRAAFTADGRLAVTAGEDGRLIVWDVARASVVETLGGQVGQITGLAISRDGSTLYSSGDGGRIVTWDLSGTRRLGRPFRVGPGGSYFPRYALSPDGGTLAVGRDDGTVALFDATSLRRVSSFRAVPHGPVFGMGYVPPDGRLLAVGGEGFVALLDPRGGRIVTRLRSGRPPIFTPGFSADGRVMATTTGTSVRLYGLPSGRSIGRFGTDALNDISLSPDGRRLALTLASGGVEIRDVPSFRLVTTLPDSDGVENLARFTPDGRSIVGGSAKGWVRLWSAGTLKPVGRRLTGHSGGVWWESMSPDATTLATGGADGTVRLWDLPSQQAIGAPLPGPPNRVAVPQFTPDGAYLFSISNSGMAYRWDVRPESWAKRACAVAGRALTRAEWAAVLPDRDYAPACRG